MLVAICGTSACALDLDHWGLWADGTDEQDALQRISTDAHARFAAFVESHGESCGPGDRAEVVEWRVAVDEGAFEFERHAPTAEERERTLELYRWARADLLRLIESATESELDWVDATRRLPEWAWWRTAREMAWHCAITETCYYLGRLGTRRPTPFDKLTTPLPAPDTATLRELLAVSQQHVETWIRRLPPREQVVSAGEVWTTRKVLRRLAGHERAENDVTVELLRKARLAQG